MADEDPPTPERPDERQSARDIIFARRRVFLASAVAALTIGCEKDPVVETEEDDDGSGSGRRRRQQPRVCLTVEPLPADGGIPPNACLKISRPDPEPSAAPSSSASTAPSSTTQAAPSSNPRPCLSQAQPPKPTVCLSPVRPPPPPPPKPRVCLLIDSDIE